MRILKAYKVNNNRKIEANNGKVNFRNSTYQINKIQLVDDLFLKRLKNNDDRDYYKKYSNQIVSMIIENQSTVTKFEFIDNRLKRNSLNQEYKILKHLNDNKCVSAPKLLEFGTVNAEELISDDKILTKIFSSIKSENIYQLSQEKQVKTQYNYLISDLILAIVEQAKLGVIQNDFKKENLFFYNESNVVIIDYDQAIIDESFKNLKPKEILDKSIELDFKSYKIKKRGWLRHFNFLSYRLHLKNLFDDNGRLNLLNTSLYKNQYSTNTKNMAYHTYSSKNLFVNGIRDLEDRVGILSKINFKKGEKVLDIGSNIGILAHFLYNKGCKVTGYELDLKACVCSRYINNIDSFNIDFHHLDLDNEKSILKYETVFLFSVIHHTKNLIENGKKISESSDRIIIECRLKEDGKKPVLKDKRTIWEISSFWNFASIDDLHFYLEQLFPFHKVYKNHGKCDKSRYIIELKK